MNPDQIINEINNKWSEYIEMADDKSAIICRLLASDLSKQMHENEYLKKRLKTYERYSKSQI